MDRDLGSVTWKLCLSGKITSSLILRLLFCKNGGKEWCVDLMELLYKLQQYNVCNVLSLLHVKR